MATSPGTMSNRDDEERTTERRNRSAGRRAEDRFAASNVVSFLSRTMPLQLPVIPKDEDLSHFQQATQIGARAAQAVIEAMAEYQRHVLDLTLGLAYAYPLRPEDLSGEGRVEAERLHQVSREYFDATARLVQRVADSTLDASRAIADLNRRTYGLD